MKNILSHCFLAFIVIAFFSVIALEDYAWSSWHAYTTVHAWESLVVIVLFLALSILAMIANAIDWLHYRIWRLIRRWKGK